MNLGLIASYKTNFMMRLNTLLMLLGLVLATSPLAAQPSQIPSKSTISQSPAWVQAMYAPNPNVWEVDRLCREYYRTHAFVKNFDTQNYKRWRRQVNDWIDENGFFRKDQSEISAAYLQKRAASGAKVAGGGWSVVGPIEVKNNNGVAFANQTNVFCIAKSASNPLVMFCGTEPGEVYKSTDGGNNWLPSSQISSINSGVLSLEIDPMDPDKVFAGTYNSLFLSTNGGTTWAVANGMSNREVNEIRIHPGNRNLVFACTQQGLYRSNDGGNSFSQLYSEKTYDMKWHPTQPSKAYMIKNNPALIRQEFFTSNDTGATWQIQTNGWYTSSDPARVDYGARLAVTPADPDRVYAYLIGESKPNDVGFIGLYRSDDGGLTWTLPNGPAGGPYSANHPNLARGTNTWQYHQGFYNCALMASTTNADSILIGGLNLWRSNDGGLTFSSVSGYIGGPLSMHVDNQDFRAFGNEYWITTDGGIYRGTDFYTTQPTVKMKGVHGADYWGFGQGWNEDVVVGGMYHNGNNAHHQNYPFGEFLGLGGGEAATGYVNPGINRKTYFSDIGGRLIPLSITGTITGIPFGLAPNETYFSAESSELEFHPNCYNVAYLGRDHKLWKTVDGGGAFSVVDSFGADPDAQVKYIEISRSNPEVMYLTQQPASGNQGKLWKTTDGGQIWVQMGLPSGTNRRKVLIALDPEDENKLFAAFPDGGNGLKIYKTVNGAATWTNLTTSVLDNESVHSIVLAGGTADGIYFCTNKTVYYRDDITGTWAPFNLDLPINFPTNIARAFYRDGKIRIASYGKGIWESELHTQPSRPICTPMANALTAICSADTFFFEDHSMLNHTGASWSWTFQGGQPATSTLRNPAVTFSGMGSHLVVLTVTDGNGQSDMDSMTVTLTGVTATSIATDFESSFPPNGYTTAASGNLTWAQASGVGGYGNSSTSSKCDNYNVDGGGTSADMRAYVNLSSIQNAKVVFDVAYAEYGGQYTDTLEVLVSSDCGLTLNRLYRKGGQTLATAPNVTANEFVPNSTQWRTDTVDLSAYQGFSEVVVVFRSIGHFGQTMYVDNINVAGLVGVSAATSGDFAQLAPNPILAGESIVLRSNLDETFQVRIYDLQGKVLAQEWMLTNQQLDTGKLGLAAGNYYYMISGSTLMERRKLTVLKGR